MRSGQAETTGMASRIATRLAALSLGCGLLVGGCNCEGTSATPPATPPTVQAPANAPGVEEPAAPPAGAAVKGIYCPGPGRELDTVPPSAYRAGRWAVLKLPHWTDPPDESSRFLNVPGVRDVARAADEAFMVRRRLPDDHYMVLTAKTHEFPAGTTFDAAGRQKAFDEVAANPHAMFLGAKAITWGGRPAVEGMVSAVYSGTANMRVHHIILPIEGTTALVVTYVGTEDQFAAFFAEACDAVVAVK
jgi:hypothetical protein